MPIFPGCCLSCGGVLEQPEEGRRGVDDSVGRGSNLPPADLGRRQILQAL